MDIFYRFIYYIYMFFVRAVWLCRRYVESYHVVGPDGKQYPLTEKNLKLYPNLLVIYYTQAGTRYRFHNLNAAPYTVMSVRNTYKTFSEPKRNKLFAVNATINERVHTINAIEFNVVGNEIFTPMFNLWLCLNYLHVAASEHLDISYIDNNTDICTTRGPITFHEDGVKVEPYLENK